jgi:hypothetical protein
MSTVGRIENGAPPLNGFRRQTMMHHSRSEQAQSGMAVFLVMYVTYLPKLSAILETTTPFAATFGKVTHSLAVICLLPRARTPP